MASGVSCAFAKVQPTCVSKSKAPAPKHDLHRLTWAQPRLFQVDRRLQRHLRPCPFLPKHPNLAAFQRQRNGRAPMSSRASTSGCTWNRIAKLTPLHPPVDHHAFQTAAFRPGADRGSTCPRPSDAARHCVSIRSAHMAQPMRLCPTTRHAPDAHPRHSPHGQDPQRRAPRARSASSSPSGCRTQPRRGKPLNLQRGMRRRRPPRQLRQSAPNGAPDPQDTITGRRPEVSSNALVDAWQSLPPSRPAGTPASTMIEVRPPDSRAKPMAMPACGTRLDPRIGQRRDPAAPRPPCPPP